jgi:hypothetical protein
MSKKPKTKKLTADQQVAKDLASCVLWTLKFLKTPQGGGNWIDLNTMKSMPWEERFMNALDGYGHRIDRKLFWKERDKKGRDKKKRPRWRAPAKAHALQAR